VLVRPLTLTPDQSEQLTLNLDESGGRVIIIVAAAAPTTLEKGHYQLIIRP
jgi:hypothetical protein